MKKTLVLAVVAVFVMMPFVSFAKTAMSDSDLGAVTAKQGITISMTIVQGTLSGATATTGTLVLGGAQGIVTGSVTTTSVQGTVSGSATSTLLKGLLSSSAQGTATGSVTTGGVQGTLSGSATATLFGKTYSALGTLTGSISK